MSHRLFSALLLGILLCDVSGPVFCQSPTPHETSASVPALNAFHATIYKIWHKAWPAKDISLLASLAPDVEKGAAAVGGATLPGILRDKKGAWDRGVAALSTSAATFAKAAASRDSIVLLGAAEDLHGRYEALVRTIKPPIKELDDFHTSLYMLYHHYLPQSDMAKIASATGELQSKSYVLSGVTLPARFAKVQAQFRKAVETLVVDVNALAAVVPGKQKDNIAPAVEKVHASYQIIESMLE